MSACARMRACVCLYLCMYKCARANVKHSPTYPVACWGRPTPYTFNTVVTGAGPTDNKASPDLAATNWRGIFICVHERAGKKKLSKSILSPRFCLNSKLRLSGLNKTKKGVWDSVENRNGDKVSVSLNASMNSERDRWVKKGHERCGATPFSKLFQLKGRLKRLFKVFNESLIPPVCNVTPRKHKDEMSEHFCFLQQPHNTNHCCQIGFCGPDSTCSVFSGSVFLVRV